jgi:hypothetical protein
LKLLADVSLELFKNKKTSLLYELKSKSNFKDFHNFLRSIGLVISIRQEKILERRYNDGMKNNTICMKKFRSEFISIGKKKIKELKQKSAINSFIRSLSRGEQRKSLDDNNNNNNIICEKPSSSPISSSPNHKLQTSPRNLMEEKEEKNQQKEIILDKVINKKRVIKKEIRFDEEPQIIVQTNSQTNPDGEDWFGMTDPLSPTKKKLFGISPNKINNNNDIIENIYNKIEGRDLLSNEFFGDLEPAKIPPKIKDIAVNNKDIKKSIIKEIFVEEEEIEEDDLYNNEVSPLKNNHLKENFSLDNDDESSLVSALSISDNDYEGIEEEEEDVININKDYEIEGSEVDDMVNMNESFYE